MQRLERQPASALRRDGVKERGPRFPRVTFQRERYLQVESQIIVDPFAQTLEQRDLRDVSERRAGSVGAHSEIESDHAADPRELHH